MALRVAATLPEGAAALALVRRRVLNGFSVEFRATRERRDAAGNSRDRSGDIDRALACGPAGLSGEQGGGPGEVRAALALEDPL